MSLLYRRNKTNGTWVAKVSDGHGAYWTKAFAEADDFDASNGKTVLDFYQAQDTAKQLARRQPGDDSDSRPVTVAEALDAYENDLKARGGSIYNARHPRSHLTPVLLSKPVALLDSRELRKWRESLLAKGLQPSSVVRYCKVLRACLNMAASHDQRITNKAAWGIGLESLPDATVARNVILDDATVRRFVSAAYGHDTALGLFVHVLAETGARPSQAARLLIEDLHSGTKPKLSMPKSAKGGSKNRVARKNERINVPISPQLSQKLKQACKGRSVDAPLLLDRDGNPWGGREGRDPAQQYRYDIREIVTGLGLDPDEVTAYSLRHSAIIRGLLARVPVRIVAATHDTSVAMIEKHYSKFIADFSDDISRGALLDHHEEPVPTADNIIPIGKR